MDAALCAATRANRGRSASCETSSRSASVATPRPHAWRASQRLTSRSPSTVNTAAVPAKPPFSVTTKVDDLRAARSRAIHASNAVAVVGVVRRERGHRDRRRVAHHLEDRVEIVVVQVAQLDVAHAARYPP